METVSSIRRRFTSWVNFSQNSRKRAGSIRWWRKPSSMAVSSSLMVDRNGLPLVVVLSWANVHDSRGLIPVVDALAPVRQRRGRPQKQPDKLHADKAYDGRRCRQDLRRRGMTPRIARRGVDSSQTLGRHR